MKTNIKSLWIVVLTTVALALLAGCKGSGPTITGPSISAFQPTSGEIGTEVLIMGADLADATDVKFNGVSTSQFTARSDGREIRALVPSGATTGPIAVTTPFGSSTSVGSFHFISTPPALSSIDPTSGGTGALVTLRGSHLANATVVSFQNGGLASIVSNSDTQIVVTVPDGAISGWLSVETSGGSAMSPVTFTVLPTPRISYFLPSGGLAGTRVEIHGTHFEIAQQVRFGERNAIFSVISDSEIWTTVPTGTTSGRITVIGSAGIGVSSNEFMIVLPPTVSSFAPSQGVAGTTVTIQGGSFTGALHVLFSGHDANFTVVSDTQISASVPDAEGSSQISVVTLGGTASSSTQFTILQRPRIASATPSKGTVGTSVTFSGIGFTGASVVQFNGKNAASFSVTSDRQMSARVPVGATTGKISVTTPLGTGISASDFTVDPECFSNCPEWKLTGSNLDARYRHAAARLSDGRVLVTGGIGSNVFYSSEIFDPATQSWSRAEECPIRASEALSLSDGRVLATDSRSSVAYDPASGHWSSPSRFGTERFEQTFTVLTDGRVLMAGGEDHYFLHALSSAEIYDPQAQIWSNAGSMSTARESHTATLLADGKTVLLSGGFNDAAGALKSAELYDIPSGTFSMVTNSMLNFHAFHNAVLLQNGKVLIVNGGDDAELFDSQTNSFAPASQPLFSSSLGQAVVLPQGTVLVTADDRAELYQPSTDSWTVLPSLQKPRPFGTITLLSDGKVLAAGGLGEDLKAVAPAEIFCRTGCD